MVSLPQLGRHDRAAVRRSVALERLFDAWSSAEPPASACIKRVRGARHGDLRRWLDALDGLPVRTASLTPGDVVRVGADGDLSEVGRDRLLDALRGLMPWRKGPFELFGIHIDAEWRSDRKWRRVQPHVDLAGKRVLDVGCGNGYFGWRMLAAGARSVVGIDPSLLFVLQHAAITSCAEQEAARNLVLPLRLEELARPASAPEAPFDVAFSMGVVYHRRDPQAHLSQLANLVTQGGLLVLETLIAATAFAPQDRYARMRNVWQVPDVATIDHWLTTAGFTSGTVADVTRTTPDEQRTTQWMPHQSLADALDPADPTRTVEGHPAPTRAVILAHRAFGGKAECLPRRR